LLLVRAFAEQYRPGPEGGRVVLLSPQASTWGRRRPRFPTPRRRARCSRSPERSPTRWPSVPSPSTASIPDPPTHRLGRPGPGGLHRPTHAARPLEHPGRGRRRRRAPPRPRSRHPHRPGRRCRGRLSPLHPMTHIDGGRRPGEDRLHGLAQQALRGRGCREPPDDGVRHPCGCDGRAGGQHRMAAAWWFTCPPYSVPDHLIADGAVRHGGVGLEPSQDRRRAADTGLPAMPVAGRGPDTGGARVNRLK